MDRRSFLKTSALIAGAATVAPKLLAETTSFTTPWISLEGSKRKVVEYYQYEFEAADPFDDHRQGLKDNLFRSNDGYVYYAECIFCLKENCSCITTRESIFRSALREDLDSFLNYNDFYLPSRGPFVTSDELQREFRSMIGVYRETLVKRELSQMHVRGESLKFI